MVIEGKRISYGEWLTPYVIRRIQNETLQFGQTLQKALGTDCNVKVKLSKWSEASYVRIEHVIKRTKYEVSFRNHGNFKESSYDKAIYFYHYESTDHCFTSFLRDELPEIKRLLEEDYAWEREITLELNKRLDEIL